MNALSEQQKLPISVCMISGAEAHRIGKALESVQPWVSEVIVVLNEEVSDGTDTIAASYGAQVYREPWKGFIDQKNSANDKATQPWILGLDADEVVSPQLREEIFHTLANEKLTHSYSGFDFPRLSFFQGRWIRHGDWYPDRQLRLWKRGKAVWGGVNPHGRLSLDGKKGRLRSNLLHYSGESIDRMISKIIPYSNDFAEHFQQSGKAPCILHLGFRPFYRFFRAYFLRLGFLDGWQGYFIAWTNAYSAAVRYSKTFDISSPPEDKR
ncbi:MAG: glycosyltransferase family 2 protein [Limisphaerales bacterium]|jgi:glycosyltransferase involved in cell wall biosynthesis|nr:glycosyltransferase family 2 protein [Verrucomicrobiota bacterium]